MKCKRIFLLMVSLFVIIALSGCRKKENDTLLDLKYFKKRIEQKRPIDQEVVARIDKAISECEDKKDNTVPILFSAKVANPKNSEEIRLFLAFYDEDGNLMGFGIREKADNQYHFIEERYPIYIQQSPPQVWSSLLSIHVRTDNQIKDETAWSLYMRGEGELNFPEFKQGEGESSFLGKLKKPPIWLSLPDEPNSMPEVFVYDKDGNVSEFITIENELD